MKKSPKSEEKNTHTNVYIYEEARRRNECPGFYTFALLARISNDIFACYTPRNRRSLICFFYLLLSLSNHSKACANDAFLLRFE